MGQTLPLRNISALSAHVSIAAAALEKVGVAAAYTPKDFELNRIMADVVRIVERANG